MLIERHGVFWYEAYGYVRNKWLYIAATPNLERLRFSMWKAATRTDYPTDQAASVQLDFYGRLWFERTTP